MNRSTMKYYILLVLAMIFWGGSWVSAKIVVSFAPPMTVGFFRFLIASLLFVPLLVTSKGKALQTYTRQGMGLLLILGITGIFGYGTLFLIGMQFTTAAQGSIIAGINPTTVSLLAFLFLKERLTPKWRYIGFLLSFLGIVFVVGIQALIEFRIEYMIGNLILLCAMITWGLYSILGKTVMKKYSSLETTAIGIFFGTILFFVGAIAEQFWTLPIMREPAFWVNIIYMGIFVTVFGFLFYFLGIKNLGASNSAVFISLVPVFGTLFSILILHESLFWTFILGLALVVVGIIIINYPKKQSNSIPRLSLADEHHPAL